MTKSWSSKLDDGTAVEVEYFVEEHGAPASWTDPAEPTIVAVTDVRDGAGNEVMILESERQRIEEEIGAALDNEPYDEDPDW